MLFTDHSLNAPAYVPDITSSCLLTSSLCAATTFDGFAFSTSIWASLQLTWTSVLFVAQIWQIARQMTTFEVSNLGRYGFMGGKGGSSMATQAGFMQQHGPRLSAAASLAAAEGDGDLGGDGPNQVQGPRAGRHSHGVAGALAGGSSWLLSSEWLR